MPETRVTARTTTPPGPPPRAPGAVAGLRQAWSFFSDPIGLVGGRFGRYGDVYYVPGSPDGLFVLRHPDHLREVLVTRADDFQKKHSAFERLDRVLGQGLLTTDGDVWRRHRRLLAPAFGKRAVESYVDAMVAATETTRTRLRSGKVLDFSREMVDLTLRVVGSSLLGIELDDEVDLVGRAMRRFQLALAVPESAPAFVRVPADVLIKRSSAELDTVIHRVIEARRRSPSARRDLLSMLLEAVDPENPDDRLSSKEIRDELVTFLLAGHETTSNVLSWALYLLSQSPANEARMCQEIDRELGGRLPRGEDVERLRFTERVVKEAMRLYPPAYILVRRAARDTRVGPYEVPRGAEIALWIYFTHRDERLYPEPERFLPDRFLPELEEARHKQAYLPFGAGPRACIGRSFAQTEAIVILATLYQRFTFRFHGRAAPPVRPRLTLGPTGGLPLEVRARS